MRSCLNKYIKPVKNNSSMIVYTYSLNFYVIEAEILAFLAKVWNRVSFYSTLYLTE